jgi:hypothetical protein
VFSAHYSFDKVYPEFIEGLRTGFGEEPIFKIK